MPDYVYETEGPHFYEIMKLGNFVRVGKHAKKTREEMAEWIEKWRKKGADGTWWGTKCAHEDKYYGAENQKNLLEFFKIFCKVFPECKDADPIFLMVNKDIWKVVKGKETPKDENGQPVDMNKFIKENFSQTRVV